MAASKQHFVHIYVCASSPRGVFHCCIFKYNKKLHNNYMCYLIVALLADALCLHVVEKCFLLLLCLVAIAKNKIIKSTNSSVSTFIPYQILYLGFIITCSSSSINNSTPFVITRDIQSFYRVLYYTQRVILRIIL